MALMLTATGLLRVSLNNLQRACFDIGVALVDTKGLMILKEVL